MIKKPKNVEVITMTLSGEPEESTRLVKQIHLVQPVPAMVGAHPEAYAFARHLRWYQLALPGGQWMYGLVSAGEHAPVIIRAAKNSFSEFHGEQRPWRHEGEWPLEVEVVIPIYTKQIAGTSCLLKGPTESEMQSGEKQFLSELEVKALKQHLKVLLEP